MRSDGHTQLEKHSPDLIVLAGWMHILSPACIDRYRAHFLLRLVGTAAMVGSVLFFAAAVTCARGRERLRACVRADARVAPGAWDGAITLGSWDGVRVRFVVARPGAFPPSSAPGAAEVAGGPASSPRAFAAVASRRPSE